MHTDMQPLLPFFAGNGLWGLLSVESLHNLCLALGAGGLAVLALALLLQRPGLRGEGR